MLDQAEVSAAPAGPAVPAAVTRPAAPVRFGRLRLWAKYAAGSVVATVLGQIAFTVCYGVLNTSAAVASIAAFLLGVIPNYLLNKAWAWNDHSAPRRRALITYAAIIGVTNAIAIGVTTLANTVVRSHVASHDVRTLLVDLAYLASYGVMFVVKFLLFDSLVFQSGPRHAPAQPAG